MSSRPIETCRLFSVFLSALLIILGVSCCTFIFRDKNRSALIAMAFLGFHPVLVRIGSSISNDNLSWLISMLLFRLYLTKNPFEAKWLDDFQKATPAMRVVVFDQLRMQRNPALLDQAIDVIEGDQDSLIIAAVRYLRELSGRYIGNDKARWKEWRTSKVSRLNVVMSSSQPVAPPAEKGFSAVEAFDDLAASQETGEDFLQLYLRIHFPQSINESNLEALKGSIEELKGESVPMQYRKGVLFFFLALAETKRMAAGYPENADEVFSDWNSSLGHFRAAGSIGKSMSEELIKIINLADENRDKKLDSNELKHIIQSRS